ncbi:MAG: 1,2-phenylacetyl-CoA epoxidase subunit PaaC [Oxalobacteraceae bacterium]
MDADKFHWLLRAGDNALVLSQRLSEWCGKGPVLEEDMALTNISLDLIGQATLWLSLAGKVEGRGRDEDALAFLRDVQDFHNLLLVEQPNGDYAHTLMRQFYFDLWHCLWLESLQQSCDAEITQIAEKSLKEVVYHLRRSTDLVIRLGDGSQESHARLQRAADALWMFAGEAFIDDELDHRLASRGIAPLPGSARERWLVQIAQIFSEATLTMPPADAWMQTGGKQGRHTEHLGYLLAEMQFLQRAYPGAQW